jgi:hypothetical protein
MFRYLTPELSYQIPEGSASGGGEGWHFVDWEPTLHKECAELGIMVFCLKAIVELGQILGIQVPPMQLTSDAPALPVAAIVDKLTTSFRRHYYDAEKETFVSGPERQISWASASWAIIAGIPENQEQAAKAMRVAYEDPSSVKAMTPYLHHYLCEALIIAGLQDLAIKHIKEYWGSMVQAGAETFFEAWDPRQPRLSPYGDLHANSFCHAWSCTPALLLRQLGFA